MKFASLILIAFFMSFPSSAQAINPPWSIMSHAKLTNKTAISICKADDRKPRGWVCKRPTDLRTARTCDKLKKKSIGIGRLRLFFWQTRCDLRYIEVNPRYPNRPVVVFGCRFFTTIGLPTGGQGRCDSGTIKPFGFADPAEYI